MKKTILALTIALVSLGASASSHHAHNDHASNDHNQMEHSQMGHATMDHSTMDHDMMDQTKMDHSSMSMEGMSEVGMPAKGAKPDKVVHVLLADDMSIRFKKAVQIEPNDVVQFVVMNTGKIEHEFAIGSLKEQLEHREMMKSMGNHAHDSGSAVTVAPGKAKQLLWHFHGKRDVEFACNIPGHAEAGMVKRVTL